MTASPKAALADEDKICLHPNRHMILQEFAIWQLCHRLAHKKEFVAISNEKLSGLFRKLSRSSVNRTLQSLVAMGWLEIVRNRKYLGDQKCQPVHYRVIDHPEWASRHPGQCPPVISGNPLVDIPYPPVEQTVPPMHTPYPPAHTTYPPVEQTVPPVGNVSRTECISKQSNEQNSKQTTKQKRDTSIDPKPELTSQCSTTSPKNINTEINDVGASITTKEVHRTEEPSNINRAEASVKQPAKQADARPTPPNFMTDCHLSLEPDGTVWNLENGRIVHAMELKSMADAYWTTRDAQEGTLCQ
jgi:hypothetical protein